MNERLFYLLAFCLAPCFHSCLHQTRHLNDLFEQACRMEQMGNVDSATVSFMQVAENSSSPILRSKSYNKIGDIQLLNSHYADAYANFQKAWHLDSALEDKSLATYSLRGMGKSFAYRELPDSALLFFQKAFSFIEEVEDSSEIANIYNNLANVHESLQNYGEALRFLDLALDSSRDSTHIYRCFSTKGSIFLQLHQYDSAYSYLCKGSESQNLYTKTGCYIQLSEWARLTNDASYTHYLELTTRYRDSLAVLDRGGDIAHMEKDRFLSQNAQIRHRYKTFIRLGILILSGCGIILTLALKRKRHRERGHWDELKREMIDLQESISQSKKQMKHYVRQQDYLKGRFFADCDIRPLLKQRIARLEEGTATKASERVLSTDELAQLLITTDALFGNFASRLQLSYGLGDTDLHFCCLLKLGIKSNHIGLLLNASSEALRKRAQRLCKNKFKTDLRLEEFIASFQ